MTKKAFLILALLATVGLAAAPQQQEVKVMTTSIEGAMPMGISGGPMAPMATGTGVVFGQVTEADSNRPVAGALVTLNVAGATPLRVMADAQGRFGFRDLPPGRFNLSTMRPGWVDGAYGRTRPAGPALTLSMAAGEKVSGVTVPMWRYAVIAGRVVDESGDPLVSKSVRVLKRTTVGGKVRLVMSSADSTDDRGIFRIAQLEPGEYVVAVPMDSGVNFDVPMGDFVRSEMVAVRAVAAASAGGGGGAMFIGDSSGAPAGMTEDGRTLAFPTLFYPTSTTAAKAQVITLTSGEERTAIDFQLRPVPTSKVSGTMMGPEGPTANLPITMVPVEAEEFATQIDTLGSSSDGQGKFTFNGVPPGQYILRATRSPRLAMGPGETTTIQQGGNVTVFRTVTASGSAPLPTDPTLWAEMMISVGGRDLADLTIGLRPGLKVNGMVQFNGTAERPAGDRLPSIALNLEPAESRPGLSGARGRVDPSGTFTTMGVPPGKYFIRVIGAPQGWTFHSATVNGRDASVVPIDIDSNDIGGAMIAFTDKPSEFAGDVSADTGLPETVSVLVFPSDPAAWVGYGSSSRRFSSTRVGKDGKFRIMNLPAGEYFAVAIQDRLANDWQNPRFLESLAPEATRVRVRDAERVTQLLKVSK